MKVLFTINSYVDYEWENWKNRQPLDCPAHYLWGATHLSQHGIDVEVLPYQKYVALKNIGYKLKLGDLDQQFRVLKLQNQYDLIYSSGQDGSIILSLLRVLGILRKPIVVKLERPLKNTFWNKILIKFFAQGHDKILCLSKRLYDQMKIDFGIVEGKLELLEWGADLPSYQLKNLPESPINSQQSSAFIISAGSTKRDFNTLVQAFSEIRVPLHIYCSGKSAPTAAEIPSNVSVRYNHPTDKKALSFREILLEYHRSYAIAIPLDIPPSTADYSNSYGLTSLLDAMAMGKAVVITRNKQIDIDVEKEGIGIWVDYKDIKGWQKAITYLLEHPKETREMGLRARRLCEDKYNLEKYASVLADSLKSVGEAKN